MSDKDTVAFGSARAYRLAEEDENTEYMNPLNTKDGGTPFESVGPSMPVRRGATWLGASEFIRQAEETCKKGEPYYV